MSKSEQLTEQQGRCGVGGQVCFHFPLDSGDFFIDVTMRYVRSVEETKRVAVEAIKLSSRKSDHKVATNEIRPVLAAVSA